MLPNKYARFCLLTVLIHDKRVAEYFVQCNKLAKTIMFRSSEDILKFFREDWVEMFWFPGLEFQRETKTSSCK